MSRILFLVTGMSPQIVTETIWALACDPDADESWVPDQVRVLSTKTGLSKIREMLFDNGRWEKFKSDYPCLQKTQFGASSLVCIGVSDSETGQFTELDDLKTPEHNEAAANSICQFVREFTDQPDVDLHVSIAGGRKTMGFYAGYALSVYGRAQDRLSHVLVDSQYESAESFFYPTPESRMITSRSGARLDASEAKVWLASIPFIRMRDAVRDKHALKSSASFGAVVNQINESFKQITLTLLVHKRQIQVNQLPAVKLSPSEFAFLHWFAERQLKGESGIVAPTVKNTDRKGVTAEQSDHIQRLTDDFVPYLERQSASLDPDNHEFSFDKTFFESTKSRLMDNLRTELGLELAAKINLAQEARGKPFYLDLPAGSIQIDDRFADSVPEGA